MLRPPVSYAKKKMYLKNSGRFLSFYVIISYVNSALVYLATTEVKLCDNKAHSLHLPSMNHAAFYGINAGGVDIGVA